MEYSVSDFLIFALLLVSLAWYLKRCSNRGEFEGFPRWFVPTLIGYHLAISGVSYFYILKFGGDSTAYWNLTADVSQNAEEWMDYWGRNTFFIQWLNYYPSKILKLSYLAGCFIYSCLSALGFVWLVILSRPIYLLAIKHSQFFSISFILLFFLPGPHFWTGIVGKEALIWFCMMLAIRKVKARRILIFVLATGILIWIRPLLGIIILGVAAVYSGFDKSLSTRMRNGILVFSLVGVIFSLGSLSYMMHLDEMSFRSIGQFSESQYDFLENFEPNTSIPMKGKSYFYRLFAVGFRPLPGEIPSFWGLFAGLENLILLILSLGLFPALYYSSKKITLFLPLVALIVGIGILLLSIALSVNVLGIMIRLKSSVVPLLAISGWFGWFLLFYQRSNSKLI